MTVGMAEILVSLQAGSRDIPTASGASPFLHSHKIRIWSRGSPHRRLSRLDAKPSLLMSPDGFFMPLVVSLQKQRPERVSTFEGHDL
jgi:hypothetical protein